MPLRDMDREQMWLLPPSLDELLPQVSPTTSVTSSTCFGRDGVSRLYPWSSLE